MNTSAAAGTTPLGSGPVTVNTGGTLVAGNADAFGYAGGAAPASIEINGGTVTDLGSSNDALGYNSGYANLNVSGGTVALGSATGQHTTMTGLTMTGGTIQSLAADGAIFLNGPVTTNANSTTATISVPQLLRRSAYSSPVVFTVASGSGGIYDLTVSSAIVDGGDGGPNVLVKNGGGSMLLTGRSAATSATAR